MACCGCACPSSEQAGQWAPAQSGTGHAAECNPAPHLTTCSPRGISAYCAPTMMRSLAPAHGDGMCEGQLSIRPQDISSSARQLKLQLQSRRRQLPNKLPRLLAVLAKTASHAGRTLEHQVCKLIK